MRSGSILFLLVSLMLAARGSNVAAVAQVGQIDYLGQIGYGERVSAELTPDVPAHVWEFEGGEGDEISIAMTALEEGLDPYLLLLTMGESELDEFLSLSGRELGDLDAAAEERGLLLALDDDGGGDLNSLIRSFVLPADGPYFIVATSCCTAGSSGVYELALQPGEGRRIEYWGAIGYGERVSAELTPNVPAHVWEFEGGEGDEIAIAMTTLEEGLDPFLLLLEMSDADLDEFLSLSGGELDDLVAAADERGLLLDFNDDDGEDLNSLIPSIVLPAGGRYFIVATSCCTAGSSGVYELALQPAEERRIEYAGAIGYGERVSAELTPNVPAHVWEFEGGEGDEISIAMTTLEEGLDPFLLLLEMSDADPDEFLSLSEGELGDLVAAAEERGLLLALDDDGGGDLNSLVSSSVLPAGGRYFIVVTSCCTGDSSGPYELALDLVGEPERQAPGEPTPEDTRSVEPRETPQPRRLPELHTVSPAEGEAGSELTLTLEGEGFSELGPVTGVAIDGTEIPIIDAEILSDRIIEISAVIPEDLPTGEQEISIFFEDFGFEAAFFVFREPDVIVEPPNPDVGGVLSPILLIFLGGVLFVGSIAVLGLLGLFAWRLFRPTRLSPPKREPPERPPAPPDIRFRPERDPGTQGIEPAGKPIKFDIDIRFRLGFEHSAQVVEEDGPHLVG